MAQSFAPWDNCLLPEWCCAHYLALHLLPSTQILTQSGPHTGPTCVVSYLSV